VALAGVTRLDDMKLAAAVGRQLPLLSVLLPAYLAVVVGGWQGLRRTWPVALVAGVSFAAAQFFVSNTWGAGPTDIVSALASIVVTVAFLRVWSPRHRDVAAAGNETATVPLRDVIAAWFPWVALALVIVVWVYLKLAAKGQVLVEVPSLHNGILISFSQKPYEAVFKFQPLATGTAVLATTLLTALLFRVHPRALADSGIAAMRQLRLPGVTVVLIVGMAYLYNYSGMVYTLAVTLGGVGAVFPLVSSYLGWLACFLTGSDTSANLLFGNLQVAAAQQLHLSPVLFAATNSSGAVAGKMISPQNISVGVANVGLIGHEGEVLRTTFWHSVIFATFIGLVACAQAYVFRWMVP